MGRDQVGRLMHQLGLAGIRRGQVRRTTIGNYTATRPADLVQREFRAARPDQLWVVDLTYLRTWAGFAYLALVVDVFSRRIVGWALTTHMRTELALEALEIGDLSPPLRLPTRPRPPLRPQQACRCSGQRCAGYAVAVLHETVEAAVDRWYAEQPVLAEAGSQ